MQATFAAMANSFPAPTLNFPSWNGGFASQPSPPAPIMANVMAMQFDPRLVMLLELQALQQIMNLMMFMVSGQTPPMGQMAPSYMEALAQSFAPQASGQTSASTPTPNINVENLVAALPEARRRPARDSFPRILAECKKQGVTDKSQIAYILATTVHESGAGAFMEEFASGDAYQGRTDLGNTHPGDGRRYKGRGYVQITGRNNYSNWSRKLGIDLVGNPSLAEKPEIAAQILVQGMKEGSFTGKKLSDYLGGGQSDFRDARRIINGMDHADDIAATARKLMASL